MQNKEYFCNKYQTKVIVTFTTIPAPILDNPNNYIIGLISKCSFNGNICNDCLEKNPLIKNKE